jgi:DNA topoisomerase I
MAVEEVVAKRIRQARLRYVGDSEPGFRRVLRGRGFVYRDTSGRRLTSARQLRRIRALAIPPAWTDVWICKDPRGHLQATGRDARRRKQHRYHARWREACETAKYSRLTAFAKVLPKVRARVRRDLTRKGLPREKVLAAVVRLLERSLIRVGNTEYARHNRSYGLTTIRDNHVRVSGATLTFAFRGKSGRRHVITLRDRTLAPIVKQCRKLPGQEVFQYIDEGGARCNVTSADVNQYLSETAGEIFTAKDFRTWAGTILAARELRALKREESTREAKRAINQAIERVAELLGNTRAVCRKSYIHPAILDAYYNGAIWRSFKSSRQRSTARPIGLAADEATVVKLLSRPLRSAA